MKPLQKNKLSDPAEFIKMMLIIFALVSVFLFSKGFSEDRIFIDFVVLLVLFIGLQLAFVIMYKKGVKTSAFWVLMVLLILGIATAGAVWYFLKYGITFQL